MPVIQHLLAVSFHSQVSQVNNGLYYVVDIPSDALLPTPCPSRPYPFHGVMPFANPLPLHAGKTDDSLLAKTLWQW